MPDQTEQVLELARKVAQEAEVFYIESSDTPVGFEANRLKQVQSRQSGGMALRIIKDGRIGFASTSKMDDPQALVDMAVELAQFGAPAKFQMPSAAVEQNVQVEDSAIEAITIESMVEMGQSLIDRIRSHTPEILCEASVVKRAVTIGIANSRGLKLSYRKTTVSADIEGTLIRDTDMLFVGDRASSCRPIQDVNKLAESTIKQLDLAKRIVPAPVGELPVIFTPRAVLSSLIYPLAVALNGKTVLQGSSPLGNSLGQQVLASNFSLWDDPTQDYIPGSRPWDDEGLAARRIPLIDRGVVATFLYDLQSAGMAGTLSTASASRGLGSLPSPSLSVAVIDPGDTLLESLISGVTEGILADELLGSGQGNVLGGDFGGNLLLGYKIERGEIVGRVKNTMIAGNIYAALKDIALSLEREWVGGFLHTPHIYCPRVSVSSTG
ncbi:MAG: peptidase modulator of gyrase [Dehalococcoidia bacterium]|nr:peptidase modulator of gyrase [Dehalococcoidia bacterium]